MTAIDETTHLPLRIRECFAYVDAHDEEMKIQFARIAVLYQDVMLEMYGVTNAGDLRGLKNSTDANQRFYFLRRGLASVWEVKQAVDVLQQNKAFKRLKATMGTETRQTWEDAVNFFQAHGGDLRTWRNDQGGHFLAVAAKFAIDNVDVGLRDSLVVFKKGDGPGVGMPFAYQLVAVALTRYKREDEDFEQALTRIFGLMTQAHIQTVRVGQVLATEHLVKYVDADFSRSASPSASSS